MKKFDALGLLRESRVSLSGNWGKGILFTLFYWCLLVVVYFFVYLLLGLCGIDSDSNIASFFELPLNVFFTTPLGFGLIIAFLSFVRDAKVFDVRNVFSAFNNTYYWKSIGVSLLMGIYIVLWALLLIIPGIIKALSYSMAPYIIAENPEMRAEEAIQRSMKMMDGHKMELFILFLIGFGLVILSIFTLFIGLLWIMPWMQVAMAKFYLYVKEDYESRATSVE